MNKSINNTKTTIINNMMKVGNNVNNTQRLATIHLIITLQKIKTINTQNTNKPYKQYDINTQ